LSKVFVLIVRADSELGLVVIQEWWGMNVSITKTADDFASLGFRALVPDLYVFMHLLIWTHSHRYRGEQEEGSTLYWYFELEIVMEIRSQAMWTHLSLCLSNTDNLLGIVERLPRIANMLDILWLDWTGVKLLKTFALLYNTWRLKDARKLELVCRTCYCNLTLQLDSVWEELLLWFLLPMFLKWMPVYMSRSYTCTNPCSYGFLWSTWS
jgi:hypothetical protein